MLRPPSEYDSKGDGRARAPWEEPRSEAFLAARRGAWVHRVRLQFRGEPIEGFIRRLASAHNETERAHRMLALQLAADCLPTYQMPSLPDALSARIDERVGTWQARPEYTQQAGAYGELGSGSYYPQKLNARSSLAARAALIQEVAMDYQAVMSRLHLVHAIEHVAEPSLAAVFMPSDLLSSERHKEEVERAAAARSVTKRAIAGALIRATSRADAARKIRSKGARFAAPGAAASPLGAAPLAAPPGGAPSSPAHGSTPYSLPASPGSAEKAPPPVPANPLSPGAAASSGPLPDVAPPPATTTRTPPTPSDVRAAESFLQRGGGSMQRRYGGARAQSFVSLPPKPPPPAGYMEEQRAARTARAQAQLSMGVARVRLAHGERAAVLGSLQLLKPHDLLTARAVAKPSPPVAIPDRHISTARATTQITHLGCIHLTSAAGASKVRHSEWVCSFAAQAGDLEALRWMRGRGLQWDELAPAKAAEGGHLHCLKYVHSCECPWDELTPAAAASGGFLDCLLYCHEEGCPWDRRVTMWAVKHGHLDVYKWAIGVQAPVTSETERRAEALLSEAASAAGFAEEPG